MQHAARQLAVFAGLVLLNVPWLSTLVPWPAWLSYVAVMLGLSVVVRRASTLLSVKACRRIERGVIVCVGGAVFVQLALLWVVRPLVHLTLDRDSALLTLLATFGRGEFPYTYPTVLGNPITVFPLLPALAFPFVLLGNIGYMEVTAYVCLAVLLWRHYQHRPTARTLSLLVLCSAPLVYLEVLARSDLVANSLLLVVLLVFIENNDQVLSETRTVALLGVGLGCLMGTRLGYVPALGVVFLYLLRRIDAISFIKLCALAVLTFALIVGPFYVWNPTIFTTYAPLGVNAAKLQGSPLARTVWPAATGLAALTSGLLARSATDLYWGVALVMLIVTLGTFLSGFIDVSYFQLSFVPLLFSLPEQARQRELSPFPVGAEQGSAVSEPQAQGAS